VQKQLVKLQANVRGQNQKRKREKDEPHRVFLFALLGNRSALNPLCPKGKLGGKKKTYGIELRNIMFGNQNNALQSPRGGWSKRGGGKAGKHLQYVPVPGNERGLAKQAELVSENGTNKKPQSVTGV